MVHKAPYLSSLAQTNRTLGVDAALRFRLTGQYKVCDETTLIIYPMH